MPAVVKVYIRAKLHAPHPEIQRHQGTNRAWAES